MRDKKVGPLRLEEKALADNLGTGRTIFVGSSTDMWAEAVPKDWILRVLEKFNKHDNTYIFQSKNPSCFLRILSLTSHAGPLNKEKFPPRTVLGTTLESNREYGQSAKAPPPWVRAAAFVDQHLEQFKKMVSIEPVMAFDLPVFLHWLRQIKPTFVSIGADSKGHKLPEPTATQLDRLVVGLREFTEVKLKSNLARIMLNKEAK